MKKYTDKSLFKVLLSCTYWLNEMGQNLPDLHMKPWSFYKYTDRQYWIGLVYSEFSSSAFSSSDFSSSDSTFFFLDLAGAAAAAALKTTTMIIQTLQGTRCLKKNRVYC